MPQRRPTWCYGTPAVAYSLWLAGEALNEPTYCAVAARAMNDAVAAADLLETPTLCHGLAGLLLIAAQFVCATGGHRVRAALPGMAERLLDLFEPSSLLGYRDREVQGAVVDNPGFLNGASGVAGVLLGVARSERPAWPELLLAGTPSGRSLPIMDDAIGGGITGRRRDALERVVRETDHDG